MSKPVFMVSVCSSVKIKGRDCGTINGHDESSSIRALMKDAREVLVGVSLEIGNFCTLSALFNQSWFVRG